MEQLALCLTVVKEESSDRRLDVWPIDGDDREGLVAGQPLARVNAQ